MGRAHECGVMISVSRGPRVLSALCALVAEAGIAHEPAFAQDPQQLPSIVVRPPRPQAERRQADSSPGVAPSEAALPNGDPPPQMTTAGPVSGYRALTAVTATKTDTPIERIPQTIAVIPRSVIDDQTARTQSEALRNVAGVTGVPDLFLHGVNYKIRGFDADRYVDG